MNNTAAFGRVKAKIVLDNLDDGRNYEIEIGESVITSLDYEIKYDGYDGNSGILNRSRWISDKSITLSFRPRLGDEYDMTVKSTRSLEERYKIFEEQGEGLKFLRGLTEEQRKILLDKKP